MQYLKDQLTGVKVHYGAVITEASIHNNKLVVCTNHEKLECDMLLPCLGMAIDGKAPKIEVNPATCEAISTPNLYAIGSAASYQYKKDLIVSGFGDAAKAANAIRRKHV
jgi:thioredoxin reductase